ncbi:GIY-YIG nuclease family protein [Mesorhizobium australicum]|uniref:Uncharacterized protein n=1 Tax=Mesorhizobium australicum TaxID=536018 RepID=A0A1X7MTR6_9HYPH|nr:GIY-YIG nuclease family protein [Mesorhizobium australicum]SMH28014.1 hypothetical protein SAMN02982922_0701 [Mesorhizobium australicum]
MTLFMTKVWGWSVPVGPLQFSTKGWRENALDQLKAGDQIVLVGTMGDQTQDDMKGRLLGVMEPTDEPVMSLDFVEPRGSSDFVDGKYKWPFGLMNRRAWSLPDQPLLSGISERKFSMDSAQGIVPLTPEEEQRVRTLRWQEEKLLQLTAHAQERIAKKHGNAKRTAPPPTTRRTGVMHMRRAPAYTYAMRIRSADRLALKIGWAFDFRQRANQFNHSSMPDLGGLKYEPVWYHLWDTARLAYHMEQRLLLHFADHRHPANNEIITGVKEDELGRAWQNGVLRKL